MAAKKRRGLEEDLLYTTTTKSYTHSFKMQEHATVYQAELEAIYQACKYMDDNHDAIKPRYVKILRLSSSTQIIGQYRLQVNNCTLNSGSIRKLKMASKRMYTCMG